MNDTEVTSATGEVRTNQKKYKGGDELVIGATAAIEKKPRPNCHNRKRNPGPTAATKNENQVQLKKKQKANKTPPK